jgi:hypothetical protein
VPDPTPTTWWPPREPKAIAVTAVLTLLVAGLAAILITGASVAYVGTLLVGCVTVGVFLASALDRRRVSR